MWPENGDRQPRFLELPLRRAVQPGVRRRRIRPRLDDGEPYHAGAARLPGYANEAARQGIRILLRRGDEESGLRARTGAVKRSDVREVARAPFARSCGITRLEMFAIAPVMSIVSSFTTDLPTVRARA